MRKILWLSRDDMSAEQKSALGEDIEIMQVSKIIDTAYELQAEIDNADIIAIAAPLGLQEEFLKLANGKPVITALSERVFEKDPRGGYSRIIFKFVKWEQLDEIKVVKHDYKPQ